MEQDKQHFAREPLAVHFTAIPESLQEIPQWVVWKYSQDREGNLKKPPFSPINGRRASIKESASWGSFLDASRTYESGKYAGVGFVLTRETGIVGIDIDHCIKEGVIDPKALWLVTTIASYAEISPSGKGIRILVKGHLPDKYRRYKRVEMYEEDRYLTITGHRLDLSTLEITTNQQGLEIAYREVFRTFFDRTHRLEQEHNKPHANNLFPTDEEVIQRGLDAKNGSNFARYLNADPSLLSGDKTQSQVTFTFVLMLSRLTDDADQIDRIVRKSRIHPDKWDSRRGNTTWGRYLIDEVFRKRFNRN